MDNVGNGGNSAADPRRPGMGKVDFSSFFAGLGGLSEAFEKSPHGAQWVGWLAALAIVCYTIVSVNKRR